jgi:hypothetical protein
MPGPPWKSVYGRLPGRVKAARASLDNAAALLLRRLSEVLDGSQ